ncbi:MAG TPA: DUF1003 domain-containing protein [Abditibacteriaceae bacterium]|jgi:uncharacterized membrane protein
MAQNDSELAHIVERNINALLEKRQQGELQKTREERFADNITRFAGSMRFVYLHLAVYGLWVLINCGLLPIKRFDPSFVMLATLASVEAIFLSTFILISQNRMQAVADKQAALDLQVSLLAEHEVTTLIRLVRAIAERMDIEEARNPELPELARDVRPEKVLDEIEQTEAKWPMHGT